MYEKVDTSLDFAKRELEILKFWKENRIFEKSLELRKGGETFTFYDGPPTANGKPHIGHVITRAFKDLVPRYKTMKGFDALRKAGWDTHGLPVELEVEKVLGISGKPDIEKYGVEPFNDKCKENVWKYEAEWRGMSERVGFWADMDNPYVTYHNTYIESVWWALKKIWDMGLIYKGHKVVPYCPRCGTPLSSHEVGQGYKNVAETSVFVKFKVKSRENEYLLAWTTTPWTLPSNVALAVNPDVEYARIKSGGEVYILAAALAESVLLEKGDAPETFPGTELAGLEYENLFGFYESDKKCCYVICDDYVTLTDGSGVVHIAPAFGEDDYRLGRKHGLPVVQLVDTQGAFTDAVTPWAGMFVKDADPLIIKYMAETGKLYKTLSYEHDYPFCWRCDTALIYYARDAWFIEMTKKREELIANNNSVNWMPDTIRTGRMGNFLENVRDWSLSRERYWGTPLPIWECPDCGKRRAVGSIAELKDLGIDVPEGIELHRPYIDGVRLRCECGGAMSRVPEVIDCWFDAGSMPFAQWHYPFENADIFDARFPADFISESLDQTRGWFYTLLAIGTLLFDRAPYRNVIVTGLIQDRDGKKMSKSKGNSIAPEDIIASQGADAVRWYFYTAGAPWLSSRFYEEVVAEGRRKFMGTLWNTYAFYALYAEIDQFDPTKYAHDPASLSVMDRWILSRLHTLIKTVDSRLENYEVTEAASVLSAFVDELSNWYVRRCRERFWAGGMERDKVNAYLTLYDALTAVTKLSAPFTPFLAESVYQNIVRNVDPAAPESVHFTDFPACDPGLIDARLESEMDKVRGIVFLGRAARNEANIKNRQPVGDMYVCAPEMAREMAREPVGKLENQGETAGGGKKSGDICVSFAEGGTAGGGTSGNEAVAAGTSESGAVGGGTAKGEAVSGRTAEGGTAGGGTSENEAVAAGTTEGGADGGTSAEGEAVKSGAFGGGSAKGETTSGGNVESGAVSGGIADGGASVKSGYFGGGTAKGGADGGASAEGEAVKSGAVGGGTAKSETTAAGNAEGEAAGAASGEPRAETESLESGTGACSPLSAEAVRIIQEELNVKNVEFIQDAERFTAYSFKPQLRTLGPKYGKLVPKIGEALKAADGAAFMARLRGGTAVLEVEGRSVELSADDVLVETGRMEGYYLASERGVTVVLSGKLTPELVEEGFVREIISKLQTMRKEAGFNVTDRIRVYYRGSGKIAEVIRANEKEIAEDVLADGIIAADAPEGAGYVKEWSVNGEDVVFGVAI